MTRGSHGSPEVVVSEVIDNAPAVIYVKDPAGKYLYVNRQYEAETGFPSEDVLGHTDFDLFPPAVAAAYRKNSLRTLEEMSPLLFDEPAVIKGKERLYSTMKFPVVEEEKVLGVCGISIDITDDHPGASAQQSRADAFFGRLLASLTPQEVRVLDLVAAGLSDREIAEKLSLSGDTVRHHVSHLLKKLRKRRGQVIIEMLKRGRD